LIEDSLYDTFRDALVAKAKRIAPGDPSDPNTKMGALVSAPHRDKVLAYIESAKAQGASVLCGGDAAAAPNDRCEAGYFVQPTILEGLGPACSINQEEIFGPVITLQRFSTEAEAIKLANDSDYGLAATIWTQDAAKAHRVATQVESGIAWINCWLVRDLRTPFGGVKSSGLGREGGFEALRFFTEPQSVCIPTY
jgi:aminomuconate-semialdehyde/2-hydroxymuconate-6-semialdehyde dehydrogenase